MVAYSSPVVHPSSMVDASMHDPALLGLLDCEISRTSIDYAVQVTRETVNYALSRSAPSTSKQTRGRSLKQEMTDSFHNLASHVLRAAEVSMPTLLVTLVYIERAKPHLQIALEQWACERVFLGALILASKYCNDSTLKNVHWAWATGVFGKADIMRIEREFLDVLNWELGVREDELLPHHRRLDQLASPTPSAKRVRGLTSRKRTSKHTSPRHSEVPELSSPSSSSGSSTASSSPRTPDQLQYLPDLPAHEPVPSHSPMEVDITDEVLEPSTGKSKLSRPSRPRRSSTLDLLLHFPIPRRYGHKLCSSKVAPAPAQIHQPPRSSDIWI